MAATAELPSSLAAADARNDNYMGSDRMLAEALSVLCRGLYELLQRFEFSRTHGSTPASRKALELEMRQRIDNVRGKRPSPTVVLSPEHEVLWEEIDRLVVLIESLLAQPSSLSPSSSTAALTPPSYTEAVANTKKSPVVTSDIHALHDVVNAIDRILSAAPRMVNQTAAVSDRQQQRLATASLVALIERLLSGREDFEAQRAATTQPSRHALLNC
ncbi:hypothetical protein BC829DRAFT_1823 [Chytridium lagenaria]|nr:hypothetical protein BC829DRAFT_1823 [Chytridium lagenaria]